MIKNSNFSANQKNNRSNPDISPQESEMIGVETNERLVQSPEEQVGEADPSQTNPKPHQPQAQAEQGVAGHMPDPEADANVLDTAQESGLYVDADEGEEVPELDFAKQVDLAEKARRKK
jgi:hypothetical protein